MEEQFFFYSSGHRLFGVLHWPDRDEGEFRKNDAGDTMDVGLVLCDPFAEEKLWSQRVFVNFARFLSGKGYAVMRFDHMGHGDSEGNFEQLSVESCMSDILSAVKVLREKTGVNKVGLLGLRLGGLLAVHTARKASADFLVLWEPVVDGKRYFQECLRSNLATQFVLYRRVIRTREQLLTELTEGNSVNIDGYLASSALYRGLCGLNLNGECGISGLPIFLVSIKRGGARNDVPEYENLYRTHEQSGNGCSEYETIQEAPFWGEQKIYFQRSESLFSRTLAWIAATKAKCFAVKTGG